MLNGNFAITVGFSSQNCCTILVWGKISLTDFLLKESQSEYMDKNAVLVSGAVVFKEGRGKRRWFIVKHTEAEDKWEIPKVFVRKGESSVRAALRMMGEQGGMSTQVLEEAGRAGGVATVNKKILPQRHLYYLMVWNSGVAEAIGFEDFKWLEYAKAVRKLSSKRERMILKQARRELRKWKREQKNKIS